MVIPLRPWAPEPGALHAGPVSAKAPSEGPIDPSTERTRRYYDEFAARYDDQRGGRIPTGYHDLIDDLELSFLERYAKDKSVLEVGCGTGVLLERIGNFASSARGVDISDGMLERARQRGLDVEFASATDLPFEDDSFDVVHSWDFLHHVPDVPKAISEISRVLRPGGRYMAVEPNLINPSILWYHIRRKAEWGLLKQNQFNLPKILSSDFDIKIRYDNTIISFLNERTELIWKVANAFTSVWPTKYLSFRYMMNCVKKDG